MAAAIMGFSTSSKYDEGGGGGCFARILGGGTRFRAMIFFMLLALLRHRVTGEWGLMEYPFSTLAHAGDEA